MTMAFKGECRRTKEADEDRGEIQMCEEDQKTQETENVETQICFMSKILDCILVYRQRPPTSYEKWSHI